MAGANTGPPKRRLMRVTLLAGVTLLGADALVVAFKWPFSRQQEIESLAHFA
jgi:hypothetical protein